MLAAAIGMHAPIFGNALNPDATTYMEVATSLRSGGPPETGTTLGPRHPPLMAILFLPFGVVLGFHEGAVHVMMIAFLALDLVALYGLGLGLGLGRRFALVPPILLSLDPVVYLNMSEGRALAPLILFTLLTLWGVRRGLDNSRWLAVAAVGAGLGFLTADSVGYLVVVAGGIGFLWRFSYVGWNVFRDRGYAVAIAIFLGFVLPWLGYNLGTRGTPFTDPRVVGYLNGLVLSTPAYITIVTVGGIAAYFLLYLAVPGLPFLARRDGWRALAAVPRGAVLDSKLGAFVLFILVDVGLASVLSSAFLLFEPYRSLVTVDTYLRHAAVVAPIAYLLVAHHTRRISGGGKALGWAVPLGIACLLLAAQLPAKVSQGIDNRLPLDALRAELEARGLAVVYSDVAIFLRYNLPQIEFRQVDKGISSAYVNLTSSDVPIGAPLLTRIYVPPVYDAIVAGYYLVERFDPDVHSPLWNTFQR